MLLRYRCFIRISARRKIVKQLSEKCNISKTKGGSGRQKAINVTFDLSTITLDSFKKLFRHEFCVSKLRIIKWVVTGPKNRL